jgi:hypothetical protein
MLALAKYALKGPYHAAFIVAMLAISAVYLPLVAGQSFVSAIATAVFIVMASALVGLIILTQGTRSGLKAIIASIVGITLITTLTLNAPALGISIGLVQWLPIIILAQTLRTTRSLALMILAGLVLAIAVILLQFLFWPELEATLLPGFQQSFAQLAENPAITSEMVAQYSQLLAHWTVLLLVAMMYMLFVSILLLSRWMQGKLASSNGYSKEFHAIALGKPAALASLTVVIAASWLNQDWISSVALVAMVAFLYQGIAVVHSKLAVNKHKTIVIGIFYAALLIFPQVMAASSIAGMLDNWLIFRRKRNIEST